MQVNGPTFKIKLLSGDTYPGKKKEHSKLLAGQFQYFNWPVFLITNQIHFSNQKQANFITLMNITNTYS